MAKRKTTVKKPSRAISESTKTELWGKAAGRCQFWGCNKLLYRSEITQESIDLAEKAHIYSFADHGPRGNAGIDPEHINDVENLMLLCKPCHSTIDHKNGKRYPLEVLKKWKHEHEVRVETVTGIDPNRKTCVVTYVATINTQMPSLDYNELIGTIFPDKYPIAPNPLSLSMQSSLHDSEEAFWAAEPASLTRLFDRHVLAAVSEGVSNFTLFALAPQPLLMRLGTLFTDKMNVEVRQLIREPKTWKWQASPEKFKLKIIEPSNPTGKTPALVLSISAHIDEQRIVTKFPDQVDIWHLTLGEGECGNDIIRCPAQLSHFREIARATIKRIMERYGTQTPLHIFPAMPVSCAVEFGRIRMPKVDMPWIIYDQNKIHNSFIHALTIGDSE